MDLIFTELLNLRSLLSTEIQKIKIFKDDLSRNKHHKITKFFEDNSTKTVVCDIKNTLKELNIQQIPLLKKIEVQVCDM